MTIAVEQTKHTESVVQPAMNDWSFMSLITSPTTDRVVAIIAIIPFSYLEYVRLGKGLLNIPSASAFAATLLLIVTMVVRRPPVRVTPNPLFWLLAFVATYGSFGLSLFAQRGVEIAPYIVTDVIAILGLAIFIYARFSLGRNIGFVPAQRQLVTSGAYAYVRHPVYTGIFVTYLGLVLRSYTPANLTAAIILAGLWVIKSFIEEGFLKKDPIYAEYMQKVKYRWFPKIA
jgi:protein-S-isoprenylcysteine O-methyltransferase Ste14